MHNPGSRRTNSEGRQRLANFLQNVGIVLIGGGALFCILLLAIMAVSNMEYLEGVIYIVGPSTFIAGGILMAISLRFDEEEKKLKEHFARLDRNKY